MEQKMISIVLGLVLIFILSNCASKKISKYEYWRNERR